MFIRIFLFNTIVLLFSLQAAAQIEQQQVQMSAGVQPALVLSLNGIDEKSVSKMWKDFMKDFYREKPKMDRKTNEWLSDDAEIDALGQGNTVDLYARTEEMLDGVKLYLWVDLGGTYLSAEETPGRYAEAEAMLERFEREVEKEKVRREIEAEEDTLKDMGKELSRMQSDRERYEREIERAEEIIRQAKANIEQNLKEQEAQKEKIAEQEELIKTVQKRYNDL